MGLKIITAPAVEPITLAEAKKHLRLVDTDDDESVTAYIKAARANVEAWLGRALVDQTLELYLDGFPTDSANLSIQIPRPPLIEVVSIKYDDTAGVEQTVSSTDYYVDTVNQPGWVAPVSTGWPTPIDAINSVRIRFRAGYLNANSPADPDVPYDIRSAMLLLLGTLYEHRENQVVGTIANRLPWGVENLLRPHRVLLGMS